MKAKSMLLGLLILILAGTSALAVPTHLTVRVKTNGNTGVDSVTFIARP